ncbi:MAG: hypothetical protein HY808_07335 [Nitrospirae bacterium]|nr:hypothetical protein [Nitrospirota bacterium]
MTDINSIASQVKLNCNISDAKFWGYYQPCGLLLRMRDLYKIENSVKPWEKVETAKIADWIGKREKLWEELQLCDFQKIEINGKRYNPFDVKNINNALASRGLIYGAGYGNLLKPSFLLAEISERTLIGKHNIFIAGREIARDLSTSPAMLRGNTIVVRQQTMNLFFRDKFEEVMAGRCCGALFHAFSEYGIAKDEAARLSTEELEEKLTRITHEEASVYIRHELGEAAQRRGLGKWWRELLLQLPYGRAELFLRGLKDVMSDTCDNGMLAYIIKNKKAGSLFFYVAMLGGFRRSIFSEIITAYEGFINTRDWGLIEKARAEGFKKAKGYTKVLKLIFDNGKISPEAVEQEIMRKIDT